MALPWPPPDEMATWRTMEQAATTLKISRRTIARWVKAGSIRVYKVPGDRKHYVDLDEIRRFRRPQPIERKDD